MAPCPEFVTSAVIINKLPVPVTVVLTYESAETESVTIAVGDEFKKQKLYTHEGGWTAVDPIEEIKVMAMDNEKSISLTAKSIECHEYTVESIANGVGFNVSKKVLD